MIAEIPFVIEEMQWRDVPEVMAVERRSFTLPWSASTYRHEILENANAHYYVLRRQGAPSSGLADWLSRLVRRESESPIIGYGGFWMIVDEAHISTIAVDVAWRGRSLGELLLSSMIEQAMALRAVSITLEVRESNLAAQNLYRKYGFNITGKRPRYYQDNQESAFLMMASGVNTAAYGREFRRLTDQLQARLARFDGSSTGGFSVGAG